MSKTKKQKEAEELFEEMVGVYPIDLNPQEYKLVRKLCVEMFEEGYWSGIAVAQDRMQDLIEKLDF